MDGYGYNPSSEPKSKRKLSFLYFLTKRANSPAELEDQISNTITNKLYGAKWDI